ncbi:hypothetical protein P168DRAFT_316345 [Aspergillus campestris IBT 28561]|uniref:Ferritin-like domain-containing protein n=1 Tax=Aspergillus campestris (strain IBT 28561) TaxID=1392248 RepID=A0A2I1D8X9_ASPC2|nr:uncharacterized protein P168DRAFT_316345 [Aspergillus campestris IBT 28561]PKY06332.1 hypothetical protein P168DRAFT_316345 [Aspergillus campestris IBT 28561]
MRIFSFLSSALLMGAAVAQGSDSCAPKPSDTQVVKFSWALEYLLERFYSQQPLNQTFLQSADNSSHANYLANFQGIQRQSRLGLHATRQVGAKIPEFEAPKCNFTFPTAKDGESWVKSAMQLESSVSGAFIGLSAYTQSPEVSFLLARLAAEHTSHAYYIATNQNATVFQANSTTLIPAYTPDYVLQSGSQPGKLGQYLHSCVTAPTSPCGNFTVGPLIGSFAGPSSAGIVPSSSATPSPSAGAGAGAGSSASPSGSPSASASPSS